MRIRQEYDMDMETALRFFETNPAVYGDNYFGYHDPIGKMLTQMYGEEVVVTPNYIAFGYEFFYDIPLWMRDFMFDAIRHSYNYSVTSTWCVQKLKEMITNGSYA